MYSQVPDQLIIKIVGSKSGSGIIYFSQAHPDIVLVLTAWHCIEGTSLSELRLTLSNQTSYQCPDDGNHHILNFKEKEGENDLAILVIPRRSFPMDEPAQQFEFLNDFFDLKDGWAVGFPNTNDGLKKLRGEFRQFKPEMPNCFEASTQREDLTTLISDGYENVKGMSGGGFFIESGGATYLAGILTNFSKEYKDFVCIKVGKLNELLVANSYHPLSHSFANSLGMNAQWFQRHLEFSIKSLGDRYTPELNFELPIAQIFEGLSRGKAFEKKVRGYFHELLQALQEGMRLNEPESMGMAAYFQEKHSWARQFYEKTEWSTPSNIQIEELKEILSKMSEDAHGFQRKIWDIQSEEREKIPKEKRQYAPQLLDSEESKVRTIIGAINLFYKQIHGQTFQLAQNPSLLLHGKAGHGKSHLVGDVAAQKRLSRIPAILILGNKLQGRNNVWQQILSEMELGCDVTTFLQTLNNIGQFHGERILFMIDALNEGEGKSFWHDALTAFAEQVKGYPYIGLVLAVRDTYLKTIVPSNLEDGNYFVSVEHAGFEGSELNAVKHFARYFGLEQPRFPILSPEFSNPQLLLLLCRSLRDSSKPFPEGLNGITTIYKDYLDAVNLKIAKKLDCPENLHLVRKGLERLAEKMANDGSWSVEHLSAEQPFLELHPNYGSKLFSELLREGVLHEDRSWRHDEDEYVDVVRFNYERFGDFLAARHLLETHINPKKPKEAFRGKGFFNDYFSGYFYGKIGIMEALSILLPEKFGIELLAVLSPELLKEEQFGQYAADAFINSLLWRRVDKIDRKLIAKTCAPWVEKYRLVDSFHATILHLAPIPSHPYNADLIHNHYISMSMAELDRYWSPFVHDAFRSEGSAINRLLSWIWSDYDLSLLSAETRRLTATILAWTLTSSSITLRDTATLALVRLLSGYPGVTTQLLQQFEKVNDLYVRERLFGVALGVTTNSDNNPDISHLAQCVYDQIFKDGTPPAHILLRDYARQVVEFALHLRLPIDVEIERIRPPYGSKLPLPYPTEEDIKRYKTNYDSKAFKKNEFINRAKGAIEHSVLGWDFNRYVIASEMRQFSSIALPLHKDYQEFKQNLPRGTKSAFKDFEQISKYIASSHRWGIDEKIVEDIKRMATETCEVIEGKLPEEQKEVFRNRILYHLKAMNEAPKIGNRSTIEPQQIARWIFRRVFELGWRKDWHGEFDHKAREYSYWSNWNTERIGKKYQWIALHEILAIIADNHEVSNWGDKPEPYQGTWEPFLRNIDPTYPYLHLDSSFSNHSKAMGWWLPPAYDKWGIDGWLERTDDLPDPRKFLNIVERNGKEWLNLHTFPGWEHKEEVGVHEKEGSSWRIWYHLRSYFVKQKDAPKIHEWLLEQRFMNEWMPNQRERYEMFEKEYYWSPAYKHFSDKGKITSYEGNNIWRQFGDSPFKGVVPVEEYSCGGGSYKTQNGHVVKPSQYLWQKMNLRQGKQAGECVNENGELVCFDPSVGTDQPFSFLVRKDLLLEFLQQNKLSLCWTLLGEKQIFHKPVVKSKFSIAEFSGTYQLLPNGEIEGGLRIVEEH
jgi:hypothetical protein